MPTKPPTEPEPRGETAGKPRRADWVREAVARHEGALLRYAARIVGDLDRGREVVQETFLKLCEKDPVVRDHLAEWLFTVCRNRALDVLRKEKRMNPMSDHELDAPLSQDPSPLQTLERKESDSLIVRALKGLSGNQQEVLRLKFQNGLSYREISRITNHTVSNVGFLIHTGLKTLRSRLEQSRATGSMQ